MLQIFKNEDFGEIRTIDENGKIWFCGIDVAKALGYKDTTKALTRHCKNDGVSTRLVTDNLGREQEIKFITEGNLYRLITHSHLPEAEKFESWVFDEVLPTIRKHGAYIAPEKLEEIQENPDKLKELYDALSAEQDINKQLRNELEEKENDISELCLIERYLNDEEMDIYFKTSALAHQFRKNEYISEIIITKVRKLMQDNKALQEENEKLQEENKKLKESAKVDSTVALKEAIPVEEHIKIVRSLMQLIDRK